MYPKNKSPSELKYERLRGMCSGAWENVRYIPIDNGIQAAWQDMAVYGWCCVYIGILIAWRQRGTVYRRCRTAPQEGSTVYQRNKGYTCVRYANTVYNRHHQSFATPGCVYRVRACVILLYYYNIIILLYYYIYIYPIYPVYPVYLIYPIYPTMVI